MRRKGVEDGEESSLLNYLIVTLNILNKIEHWIRFWDNDSDIIFDGLIILMIILLAF